jgi:phosphoribosylaminoimidazolecarboxamide formyltransferase/IMP cyclohydrolase
VKTLHPAVHAGILARRDPASHREALAANSIGAIDLVACNLYPFVATVTKPGVTFEEGIENIDIGGPTMLRAAAKNHRDVIVVVNPADYPAVLDHLRTDGVSPEGRLHLAYTAFAHVAQYDSVVSEWLWSQFSAHAVPRKQLTIPMQLAQGLRYGENPHQSAAFYVDTSLAEQNRGGIATAVQHHGKEMSYNNYLDADAAWNAVNDFRGPTCVIVKHTNPCGIATRDDLLEAYRLAVRADATSAFGGIVAFNRVVDEALARGCGSSVAQRRRDAHVLRDRGGAGLHARRAHRAQGKSKDLRVLEAQPRKPGGRAYRQVGGGWLAQDADERTPEDIDFRS